MNLLLNLLRIQTTSGSCERMQEYLFDYGHKKGWEVELDDYGNLYMTKGMSVDFPCIVAHMDTVHDIQKGDIIVVPVKNGILTAVNSITMRQMGIGGDDKCGIYAALDCMNRLEHCKIAFFVDEEIGCVGSSRANIDWFHDCRFILQADRRGKCDFVTDICGDLSSMEFQAAVEPFLKKRNFNFTHGMMTDVQALRDIGVGISCANISAGYYNPHMSNEYIVCSHLANTTELMYEICINVKEKFSFVPQYSKYSYNVFGQKFEKLSWNRDDAEEDAFFRIENSAPKLQAYKSISEMTAAEYAEYEREINSALEDDTKRLDEYWDRKIEEDCGRFAYENKNTIF